MEDNRQTHTIPTARPARERLARLMSFAKLGGFEAALEEHKDNVRRAFDKVLKSQKARPASSSIYPEKFEGHERRWKEILASSGFRDVDKALRVLREFVEGPGYVHVSPRTVALAHRLVPRLLALCPRQSTEQGTATNAGAKILSDPDRVVTRLDSFIAAYGARATLFELWNLNPAIFELLILLFDRSEFLAELAIRVPDMVDELVSSGRLRQRKTAEDTLRDLRHGLKDEDQHLWLRRYHQTEFMQSDCAISGPGRSRAIPGRVVALRMLVCSMRWTLSCTGIVSSKRRSS
jgi:glutamate-ammonia-ligase adenylyltransferase